MNGGLEPTATLPGPPLARQRPRIIISGGENVYSREVENALHAHPAVRECAVIGIPSERWGEAVHAVVVLKDGQPDTAEALSTHCHGLIAGYHCPRSIEFRDALPLSGAGKILKSTLRDPHWAGKHRDRQPSACSTAR